MTCGRDEQARQLAAEIREQQKRGGYSKKDLERLLQEKDSLVGYTGQHHTKRNVSAGQIASDLDTFADGH